MSQAGSLTIGLAVATFYIWMDGDPGPVAGLGILATIVAGVFWLYGRKT